MKGKSNFWVAVLRAYDNERCQGIPIKEQVLGCVGADCHDNDAVQSGKHNAPGNVQQSQQAEDLFGDLELRRMAVLVYARGQGIASKLENALVEFARETKCKSIWLTTSSNQTAAVKLYPKMGYKLFDQWKSRGEEKKNSWFLFGVRKYTFVKNL